MDVVLPPNSPIDTRFESNMPLQAHKHYNGLLNALVAQAVPGQPRVKYSHIKLVDEFYGDGHGKFKLVILSHSCSQALGPVAFYCWFTTDQQAKRPVLRATKKRARWLPAYARSASQTWKCIVLNRVSIGG